MTPWPVRLSRESVGSDILKVTDIQGTTKYITPENKLVSISNDVNIVRAKLQTLIDVDYWLDSGCFRELSLEA